MVQSDGKDIETIASASYDLRAAFCDCDIRWHGEEFWSAKRKYDDSPPTLVADCSLAKPESGFF